MLCALTAALSEGRGGDAEITRVLLFAKQVRGGMNDSVPDMTEDPQEIPQTQPVLPNDGTGMGDLIDPP